MQSYALIILGHLDEIERAQGRLHDLKTSMVAAGGDFRELFPEYAPKEETEHTDDPAAAPEGATWDYSQVEWQSPTDAPGAFEALMAKLQESPGVLPGDEVVQHDEIKWTEWQ